MDEPDENSQWETIRLDEVDSKESLIEPNKNEIVLKASDLQEKPSCRICYGGPSKEQLLRPCKCKGTIEYVHRHCLERWLESKNMRVCELCQHQFQTKRTRKNCWDWFRTPDVQTERRNFIGDCTCFAFLTPLGIATLWICTEGAMYYQKVKSSTLETVALVTLGVFLVAAYFTWIVLCTRYHFMMYTRWQSHNWNVRIVEQTHSNGSSDSSSSNSTFTTIPNNADQDSGGMTEQHVVRFVPVTEQAGAYTIIGIGPPEMASSTDNSTNQEYKSGA